MTTTFTTIEGVEITGPAMDEFASILTPEAQAFIARLARTFETRRQALLQRRIERQQQFDQGVLPDFLPETAQVRAADWQIAPFPAEIADRRVEITGPVDRKMIINALNSG
ncbi:MAG TPA: malate synthase A, partial [Ktedonobacterales bacterium]